MSIHNPPQHFRRAPLPSVLFLLGIVFEAGAIALTPVIMSRFPIAGPGGVGTVFIVTHPHVLTTFGWIATLLLPATYWAWPLLMRRRLDTKLGVIHFCLSFVFFNVGFFGAMAAIETERINAAGNALEPMSTYGTWLIHVSQSALVGLLVAQLVLVYNIVASLRATNHHIAHR